MRFIIISGIVLGIYLYLKKNTIESPEHKIQFSYEIKYTNNISANSKLPMIIALHGNGDSTKNFYNTTLAFLKTSARVILIEGPKNYQLGKAWPWKENEFLKYGIPFSKVVTKLKSKYNTIGLPILFGFSGGAMMAYHQAVISPNTYSYIFPISGSLKYYSKNQAKLKRLNSDVEVYSFHGKKDEVISFSEGKASSNYLSQIGIKVKFTEFDDGHLAIFKSQRNTILSLLKSKVDEIASTL